MSSFALNHKNPPTVAIILLNYNGLEDTLKCLESIKHINYTSLEVIVVDNASKDIPTNAIINKYPQCDVLLNKCNKGWAGGNNTGIRHAMAAGAEYIILLNNDTIVSEDLVFYLMDAAARHPAFGIIGPIINDMDDKSHVQTDGCLFNRKDATGFFQRKPVPVSHVDSPSITAVDIVNGCCMLISKRVFDAIGLIDERFFLIHEESDFCLRAAEAGFRCGVIDKSLVWHKHSATFNRAGNWRQRYYDIRNLFLLLHKHPSLNGSSRSRIESLLEYLKYAYYSYSIERENGKEQGEHAVVQGLHDAAAGNFGHWVYRKTHGAALIHGMLETAWRLRRKMETEN